jgi:hypothetical protein
MYFVLQVATLAHVVLVTKRFYSFLLNSLLDLAHFVYGKSSFIDAIYSLFVKKVCLYSVAKYNIRNDMMRLRVDVRFSRHC